ncbi:MAG: glutathione S-transferase family protein [Polyangiaceae bacterium]
MKLHVVRASHNCRRALATAHHLGLDVEVVDVDLASGGHKAPEYLAINPNGKVPTLVDGDLHLWESNAIMQYVASKKPGNELWPDDPRARAEIVRWQFWEANHLSNGTGGLTFQRVFKPFVLKQEPDEAAIAKATETFHTFAPVLNAQLEGRKFVTGDALTLADFSVGANFSFAKPAQFPLQDYPHVRAWLDRLDEVPAWNETAPKM